MCPPPCGPRRSGRSRCTRSKSAKSRKSAATKVITKSDVEALILSGKYECVCKIGDSKEFQPYDGCTNNLLDILADEETQIKVADGRFKVYMEGFKTIIMDAPFFPAVILLRTEE